MQGNKKSSFSDLLGINTCRFFIPVYQRDYAWGKSNCKQLYEDLKRIDLQNSRDFHFCGSIVVQERINGRFKEHYIIDGQQRIITLTLLLLAIGYTNRKNVTSNTNDLTDHILNSIIDQRNGRVIKLKLKRNDSEALEALVTHTRQPDLNLQLDKASNLTKNFEYFCTQIRSDDISIDNLYDAIQRLEFMFISLDEHDHAQLIFESLNNTGLQLELGDNVRNFVLLSAPQNQPDKVQNYVDIWEQIERAVKTNKNESVKKIRSKGDLSNFIRYYVHMKYQKTVLKNDHYSYFKNYCNDQIRKHSLDILLRDMLHYANIYRQIVTCQSDSNDLPNDLKDVLSRLHHLGFGTITPFLMEILNLKGKNELSDNDVIRIFLIIENYLFRRAICDRATNSYDLIFASLHGEICEYDGTTNHYVDKLIYHLKHMQIDSYRFPDDDEFRSALNNKNYSNKNISIFQYILERFEKSYNPRESLNIYEGLDCKRFSIEHIMPQNLSPDWRRDLGKNANDIHENWLHKLGNLTLTAYNQSMSNKTFLEKRNMENGFARSGFRMNRELAQLNHWGEAEIEDRHNQMVDRAVDTIWRMPETNYQPSRQETSEQGTPNRRCRNRRNNSQQQ